MYGIKPGVNCSAVSVVKRKYLARGQCTDDIDTIWMIKDNPTESPRIH